MADKKTKITMSHIARASGVSLSTVSLVLNGKPGLPPETREKVINTAKELGYEYRPVSSHPVRPMVIHTLGMLVKRAEGDSAPPSSNIFFSHVMAGIEVGCRQEDISLLYSTLPVDENNNALEIPRLISDPRVDGLLLVGNFVDERLHQALQQRGIPVVLVDGYCAVSEYDSVIIENFEGTYLSVKHLVQNGHKHIAYVGSFPDSKISFQYRRQGYIQALKDAGITNTYFGDCAHNDREQVLKATAQLIQEYPQVTAMVTCNDEVALTAMHGILQSGKKIPSDISIIGFDNNANTEISIPPLTTINVDKVGMGRLAVQLLINRAENSDQSIVTMRVHTRLVERGSVRNLCEE